eukprot:scaffold8408_cov149-Isochrysis_galbana.AAC.2
MHTLPPTVRLPATKKHGCPPTICPPGARLRPRACKRQRKAIERPRRQPTHRSWWLASARIS